ncbi:archaellin/type IV pilin N-terminal domain-containing protein [Aeropyrum camini]|uniref:Uncharacterized protein n=1 Tax=Aeropyrum camini SY1 = JCM 12091 TaxID=1198449 RepID=U3T9G2_9CREN|nr:archaellin/type IV pilin N-terminal domain-containing protein [Aeropyrum camini]BAN90137.1 hypothetical protein ACAM_0668 [Aeropyrum camini SY1 = JCM 12091]
MKVRRGISPVIATVIIVAVAIAISIAVAGWLFGLWGSFATGSPQIQVSAAKIIYDKGADPNSTADDQMKVSIYIVNTGSGSDKILSVGLSINNEFCDITAKFNNTTINANSSGWYDSNAIALGGASPDCNFTSVNPGDTAVVVVSFEKSGQTSVPVTITEGTVQ